jgi:hypothetical protein
LNNWVEFWRTIRGLGHSDLGSNECLMVVIGERAIRVMRQLPKKKTRGQYPNTKNKIDKSMLYRASQHVQHIKGQHFCPAVRLASWGKGSTSTTACVRRDDCFVGMTPIMNLTILLSFYFIECLLYEAWF